jgi:hypothetical protein
MNIFANVRFDDDAKAPEDKVIGGGINRVDRTGKYDFIIKKVYVEESALGAMSFVMHLETESGASLRVQEYFTNRAKETFFIDKDGNKTYLPGYNKMRVIDYMVTKKNNQNPKAEEKTIMLWDKELKKEVPVKKYVFVEWFGKPITALVAKVLENKQERNAAGEYQPIADTRETMVVDHFLDPVTLRTMKEIIIGGNADIYAKWIEDHKEDYVRDLRTIKKDSSATPVQGAVANENTTAAANHIFG